MELFRRLLLLRLHQAERLCENFMQNLLSWVHPGFSVFAGPPVEASASTSLESQARYITRPALAMDALLKLDDGNLALETPPDPPYRVLANSIVLSAYRNGPVENLHSGRSSAGYALNHRRATDGQIHEMMRFTGKSGRDLHLSLF